ncbi:MAG TPA: molecular chaperone TorD family protein [Anaerolineae bacterium]|nr:molecular chaperone TorD family protein [Anaerolineae bacterium]
MTTQSDIFSAREDWAAILSGEALVCGLLSRALYSYPERAWLQSLVDEGVFAESPLGDRQPDVSGGLTLLQTWSQAHRGGLSDEAFDGLCAGYTRLFIGPGKVLAPPWESVYFNEERLTFQEQTLQVRAWYRRFGLEAEKLHNEPDDHIGLELSFLAHLAQLALDALERQDQPAVDELLEAQRRFLSEHLLRWAPAWCDQVAQHARTDFFHGIALLTKGALKELSTILQVESLAESAR